MYDKFFNSTGTTPGSILLAAENWLISPTRTFRQVLHEFATESTFNSAEDRRHVEQSRVTIAATFRSTPESDDQVEHHPEELASDGQNQCEESTGVFSKCACTIECPYHIGVLLGEKIRSSVTNFSSEHSFDVLLRIQFSNSQ